MSSSRRNVSVSSPQRTEKQSKEALRIDPLNDLDWKAVEPAKYRPFKPIYHITMGKPFHKLTYVAYMPPHYLYQIRVFTLPMPLLTKHNSTQSRHAFRAHHRRHRLPQQSLPPPPNHLQARVLSPRLPPRRHRSRPRALPVPPPRPSPKPLPNHVPAPRPRPPIQESRDRPNIPHGRAGRSSSSPADSCRDCRRRHVSAGWRAGGTSRSGFSVLFPVGI